MESNISNNIDIQDNEFIDNKNLFELDGEKYNLVKEIEEEIIDENGVKKIIVKQYLKLNLYEKNKESYKKATKKYSDNHREELNEYRKNYLSKKYENDPEFREKEKARAKENYIKKKQLQNKISI